MNYKWYIDDVSFKLEDYRNVRVDSVLEPIFVVLTINYQQDYFRARQIIIAYNRFATPKMIKIGFVENGSSYQSTTFEQVDKVEDIVSILPDIDTQIIEEIRRVELNMPMLISKYFGV